MVTVYTIHAPEAQKLERVKNVMVELGAPVIRAVNCGDFLMALEGSHRIAAAHALELKPDFIIFEQGDDLDITVFDWFDEANWAGTVYSAGEVAGELLTPQTCSYQF